MRVRTSLLLFALCLLTGCAAKPTAPAPAAPSAPAPAENAAQKTDQFGPVSGASTK